MRAGVQSLLFNKSCQGKGSALYKHLARGGCQNKGPKQTNRPSCVVLGDLKYQQVRCKMCILMHRVLKMYSLLQEEVRGSLKSLGIILRGPRMSVENVMVVHQIFTEIFHCGRIIPLTYPAMQTLNSIFLLRFWENRDF